MTNLGFMVENSSSQSKNSEENHHGALAQLVGRGKRTFAPNQDPNPLPSSAEKLQLRSSALQQIRSADRHLENASRFASLPYFSFLKRRRPSSF